MANNCSISSWQFGEVTETENDDITNTSTSTADATTTGTSFLWNDTRHWTPYSVDDLFFHNATASSSTCHVAAFSIPSSLGSSRNQNSAHNSVVQIIEPPSKLAVQGIVMVNGQASNCSTNIDGDDVADDEMMEKFP